jgi:hypothetical protein
VLVTLDGSGHGMRVDWGRLLVGQLEFYWEVHLRPRLDGLTDEEYFWEPVEGCWSLRPGPEGGWRLDQQDPEPSPPPVTTIAWRLVHVGATCLANRASAFFGDGSVPADADMFDPATSRPTCRAAPPRRSRSSSGPTGAGTTASPASTTRACAGRSAPAAAPLPRTPWPS